ncbi:MAG: 23S rRNA (pseudouridine(1915)-N(3))-methyltransferase RlmH [Bacteroidales bacterium]|jgi:23S rRNA (pseudouridine1915-N3)-methyltransferase|nr:23S rRNA (pseudouridine(1915)-N(3))-methyltransferase RlmH [Bacteroidales bacterium]MCU0409407.1 23S rRNA (pseudouridine(1915)-N(3))-methyltransferase RlmH [Bacteroidales bacterium]
MKIILLQVGKTTDPSVSAVAETYSRRISRYSGFETITVPDIRNTKNMPVSELKAREGEKILQVLTSDDYFVLLDERGPEYRTVEFARFLEKTFMLPRKRIIFAVGGAWGFSDEVRGRADSRVSLSKMTFPHQLVRLLFLEQLYRAFTIIKGDPYHHE